MLGKMKERKTEVVLGIILIILIVVMVIVLFLNYNQKNIQENILAEQENKIETNAMAVSENESSKQTEIEKLEEKTKSMQEGSSFCKIGNTIVYYEEKTKSIYGFNINESKGTKLATLENGADKIYFDGENIYAIPSYYKGRGIYKIDLQGNVEKIYEQATLQLWLTEDKIYFVKQIGFDEINKNPQGTLCVINKDGSNLIEIAQNVKNDFFIQNDKIYYTTLNRKMYEINIDGTNQVQLTEGRRFVLATNEKCLIYVDYGDEESYHILNLETKEDSIIGKEGTILNCLGDIYVNISKTLETGITETQPTLMKIEENSKVTDIGKITSTQDEILYITEQKVYLNNQEKGNYQIYIQTTQEEKDEELKDCEYYLANKGYEIVQESEELILKTIDLK